MRHRSSLSLPILILITILGLAPFASGDIIWGTVQHTAPSAPPGEQAVVFTPGQTGTSLGSNVFAISAQTSGGFPVTITTNNDESSGVDHLYTFSTSELLANSPGSDDGSIDQLTISLPGNTFGDIYFDMSGVFSENHQGGPNDTVSFLVTTTDGTFTHVFSGVTDNGTDNWIFLNTANGERIQSVSLSDTRFTSLTGLHVSEVSGIATAPEPTSLLLLGSGLSGLLLKRKIK